MHFFHCQSSDKCISVRTFLVFCRLICRQSSVWINFSSLIADCKKSCAFLAVVTFFATDCQSRWEGNSLYHDARHNLKRKRKSLILVFFAEQQRSRAQERNFRVESLKLPIHQAESYRNRNRNRDIRSCRKLRPQHSQNHVLGGCACSCASRWCLGGARFCGGDILTGHQQGLLSRMCRQTRPAVGHFQDFAGVLCMRSVEPSDVPVLVLYGISDDLGMSWRNQEVLMVWEGCWFKQHFKEWECHWKTTFLQHYFSQIIVEFGDIPMKWLWSECKGQLLWPCRFETLNLHIIAAVFQD